MDAHDMSHEHDEMDECVAALARVHAFLHHELLEADADMIRHHLHACVLSMITGTPAVAISTDGAKIEGLYESLGLPASWVVRPNSDPDAVVATVVDAMGRSKDVVAAVSRARRILEVELAEKLTAAIREGS